VKKIRVVAALIVDPRDPSRFLVQQRLPNKDRANLWEFPGGKLEPGETDEAALFRECQEELAVDLIVGRRLWGNTHEYSDLVVQLELFAAEIQKGEPQPLGAQALKFCTPKEMQALPFCEADIPLLESLVSGAVATR
jgi:8-oxo-dGTP diphosphatase